MYFAATDEGGSASTQTAESRRRPRSWSARWRRPDQQADELGFPAFATKNTTRISGADPIADAAAAALAVFPSAGGVAGPDAVTLVDAADWPAGIAAGSLVAAPVGAPVLITDGGEVPDLTASALDQLEPQGLGGDRGAAGVRDRGRRGPRGARDAARSKGNGAAEVAAEIDKLRERLAGKPDHILVASSDEPAYAMPAAALGGALRRPGAVLRPRPGAKGDGRRPAPQRRCARVRARARGGDRAPKAMKDIKHVAPNAVRVGEEGPVENAIAFARYSSGSFGWNINDPGHGLVLANSERPLDAGGAAPLSASGTWGPLLLTDDADRLPAALTRLPARPQARLRRRSDPRRVQPRLADRRPDRALGRPAGAGRRAGRGGPGNVRDRGIASLGPAPGTPESQPSTPDRNSNQSTDEREREARPAQRPRITVEDVRALAGPSTPHFALQIRNRIQRLIAPLPSRTTRRGSRASARS